MNLPPYPDFPALAAADRAFGSLTDALGLGPLRATHEAFRQLVAAQFDELVAAVQTAGLAAAAMLDGVSRFGVRLHGMRGSDEAITSPTALLRVGLGDLDAAMQDAMSSDRGLAATAATVRAASRRRSGWQQIAALNAQALCQPSRAELDAAFHEIQQLKRELRQLKRDASADGSRQ